MRYAILPCLVVFALCNTVFADGSTRSVIREHVRPGGNVDPALSTATGWNSVHGFSWQMYLIDDITGAATITPHNREFRTDQRFKLKIEAYTDLWIYVLNVEPSGKQVMLLPESGERHFFARAGQTVVVPPDSHFRFFGEPGVEQFRVVASPVKLEWANPAELARLDSGERLPPEAERIAKNQSRTRTKSIDGIQAAQAKRQEEARGLFTKSLPDLVTDLKSNPDLKGRVKDVLLLPPPSEGEDVAAEDRHRNDAILVSERRDAEDAIVIDIRLKHR